HPSVLADFGHIADPLSPEHDEAWPEEAAKPELERERLAAHRYHDMAGYPALFMVALGGLVSSLVYYTKVLDQAQAKEEFPRTYALLQNKWYFDELYSAVLVRPALVIAGWFKRFDLGVIDGIIHWLSRGTVRLAVRGVGRFDNGVVDGLV